MSNARPGWLRFLVVDDDPVIGKSFDRVLSGRGYAVITAANGEEALKKLSAEAYDVVFTDIKMPGMSGIEVAKRVKASQPWLPVVIVTGYGTVENEARAREAGVSGFLRKPLSPEMIVGTTELTLVAPMAEVAPAVADIVETPAPTAVAAETKTGSRVKDIALFLAAPFIGLVYMLLFPFVGMFLLARVAFQAREKKLEAEAAVGRSPLKSVALFLAAPFIGLIFAIGAPFIGLALLVRAALKAQVKADKNE